MRATAQATPFLQIVHFSDMHIMDPRHVSDVRRSRIVQRMLPKGLREFINNGTAPHSPWAPPAFVDFLPSITTHDPSWQSAPTWLLDTGDLTAFGDEHSLEQGQDWLKRFTAAANPDGAAFLYGNHDAWPGCIPFPFTSISAHRQQLRSRWYPGTFPYAPLRVSIPGANAELQLWTLNSVVHEPKYNFTAKGEVCVDRAWESPNTPTKDPIDDLAARIDAAEGGLKRNLRILAVHHPIHYPPPKPTGMMGMVNDKAVADQSCIVRKGCAPLVHLVLSGHTHGLYPKHGALPDTARACKHYPLGDDQCQLVVGSLSQLDWTGSPYPHHCQLLRFYVLEGHPHAVLVERHLIARANGAGEYKFVPVPGSNAETAEEILLAY